MSDNQGRTCIRARTISHFWDYTDILLDLYILQLYTIIHLFVLTLILRINFKFKDLTCTNFYRLLQTCNSFLGLF